jgi:outer membrane protein assembly factor BamB
MGLVMMDKDSNVLWHHTGYPNNDFDIGPDGMIYVIEHMVNYGGFETVELPMIPFLEDHIVQLDPKTGKELARESLMKAIEDSPYTEFMKQLVNDFEGDPTHSNGLFYVMEDSDTVPWLKAGNLLVSVRNIDALVVYNPAENKVVYATGLRSRHQHDIDLLPNGHLMIFDNQGSFTEGGYSRVIEFDPLTHEIYWQYDPAPSESPMLFESKFFGNQQRLENGNTLIAHSQAGRIIEVTPSGEIVWDYRAPLTRELDGVVKAATITTAEHIAPSRLGFLGKE